jgi:hypothetical protein
VEPVEALASYSPPVLCDPRPEGEIVARLAVLRAALQAQVDFLLWLPEEFETMLRMTNGLGSAGVPSKTGSALLLYPLSSQEAHRQEAQK